MHSEAGQFDISRWNYREKVEGKQCDPLHDEPELGLHPYALTLLGKALSENPTDGPF